MATNLHLLRSLFLSTRSIKAESLKLLESMIFFFKSPDNSNTDEEFQSIAIDEITNNIVRLNAFKTEICILNQESISKGIKNISDIFCNSRIQR